MEQSQPSVQHHREVALREHDYDACGNGCILVRDEVRWDHQTRVLCFISIILSLISSQFGLQQEEVGDTHSCGDLLYADAGGELNWTLLFLYYFISVLYWISSVISYDALSRDTPGFSM